MLGVAILVGSPFAIVMGVLFASVESSARMQRLSSAQYYLASSIAGTIVGALVPLYFEGYDLLTTGVRSNFFNDLSLAICGAVAGCVCGVGTAKIVRLTLRRPAASSAAP